MYHSTKLPDFSVPEEDPLLNGSAAPQHPTIVTSTETTASQLNGNNKKANNGGTTSVAPPTNIKVNGVANLSSATKVWDFLQIKYKCV